MPKKPNTLIGEVFFCSFCGRSQLEVRKLIAGPSVYICNECIRLCVEIIVEELPDQDDLILPCTDTEANDTLVDRMGYESASAEFANTLLEVLQKDLPDKPLLTNLVKVVNQLLNKVIKGAFERRLTYIQKQLKPVEGLAEEAEELERRLELLKPSK